VRGSAPTDLAHERVEHFCLVGKPMLAVLREQQLAVERHVEDPTAALLERGDDVELTLYRGRETRGPGLVVSRDAVADRDRVAHGSLLLIVSYAAR
jgi:hypothetical protein